MSVSQDRDNYAAMHRHFGWQVPDRFNIAEVCCGRWARRPDAAGRIAIRAHAVDGPPALLSYAELQRQANAMSNLLVGLGVSRGDRVAIVIPQRFETAIAYMAIFQLGAVAMPLSMLFGPEALEYRLHDSEAVVAICDESSIDNVLQVRDQCPHLRDIVGVGGAAAQADVNWAAQRAKLAPTFSPAGTHADDGAVLIYTSGTTGPPKGALIPHRALIGNLSGFVCSQNWFGFAAGEGESPHPNPPPVGEGVDVNSLPPLPGEGGGGGRERPFLRKESSAVLWSPADWAWTGGLMDALLPTLYFGRPIVAFNGRFSPDLAFTLMQEHGVTHTFLFPTALKAMMKAYPEPRRTFRLHLQAIMSAGEAVGDAVFAYCREQLGVTVNEMFGQTEINYVVGNCSMEWNQDGTPWVPASAGTTEVSRHLTGRHPTGRHPGEGRDPGLPVSHRATGIGWPARPGSMGRPYPGHRVAVIDDDGNECPPGIPGDVAVHRYDIHGEPDPIFFLGYWKNPDATRRKSTGDWCRTGDLAVRDEDGYLWYQGRADDVFKAAGYRIGPSEIENCLVKHPAVVNAAVVPKPDPERGAVVKAFVVLAPHVLEARALASHGQQAFDARLVGELQAHVKGKLAPYEYPKEIEFIDVLPMTTTGKVQRRVLRLLEEDRARGLL